MGQQEDSHLVSPASLVVVMCVSDKSVKGADDSLLDVAIQSYGVKVGWVLERLAVPCTLSRPTHSHVVVHLQTTRGDQRPKVQGFLTRWQLKKADRHCFWIHNTYLSIARCPNFQLDQL